MNLRDRRLAAGLTQEDVERRSGLSQSLISGYETGKMSPTAKSLKRINRVLAKAESLQK